MVQTCGFSVKTHINCQCTQHEYGENSTLVTEGEVYEYPANSGHSYTVVGVGMSSQTVEPGVDLDGRRAFGL